jgi:hypothetical protein
MLLRPLIKAYLYWNSFVTIAHSWNGGWEYVCRWNYRSFILRNVTKWVMFWVLVEREARDHDFQLCWLLILLRLLLSVKTIFFLCVLSPVHRFNPSRVTLDGHSHLETFTSVRFKTGLMTSYWPQVVTWSLDYRNILRQVFEHCCVTVLTQS